MSYNPPSQQLIDGLKAKWSAYSDQFVRATPKIQYQRSGQPMTISQLQTAYQYNDIQKQTFCEKPLIAIVMYGSYPQLQENFNLFCQNNNLPQYNLNIIPINNPSATDDGGPEQCIDTQISYSCCNNAEIIVVQAESTAVRDVAVAIDVAKTYKPLVLNMSWGIEESLFTQELYDGLKPLFLDENIAFVASSGDENYVQWPASDMNVLCVGGTSLFLDEKNGILRQEAWSGTGCGPSEFERKPYYQCFNLYTEYQKRTCVDVSCNADPETGVICYYNGVASPMGGSSISAPQMSGLIAIINGNLKCQNRQTLNTRAPSKRGLQLKLYMLEDKSNYPEIFFNVTKGSSGSYNAGVGWNVPTGLGSLYGGAILDYIVGNQNLATSANNCSLDIVSQNLPPSIGASVDLELVQKVYVWVVKDKESANKIVDILRKNGFSNVSLDNEGTTITARSG